jgi:hypothetical protein
MAITYPTTLDVFTNPTSTSLLTSPDHAQQHSDINDAVEALEAKVAIGNTVLGTYTSYTPTWTGLTIGNGTVISSYARVNNFIHYLGVFALGTTSAITGNVSIGLPVNAGTPWSPGYNMPNGSVNFHDISTANIFEGVALGEGATTMRLKVYNSSSTYVGTDNLSSTIPMTWANTDRIQWNIIYRA